MSGLENMQTRIDFNGGVKQVDRLNEDKLKSLKKALNFSYQSATAIMPDEREFRCLINPDKLKNSYDNKIISIPFKDVCLSKPKVGKTTEGEVEIGLKAGDVITWKENNTNWIVYLQRFEETAYFRAEIRRCRYEVSINDKIYKVYACGPEESSIVWNLKKGDNWNDLNYSLEMYITKNEDTEQYLQRFTKIKLNDKPWEVQAVDNMSLDGVIVVALKEDFSNTIAEAIEEEKEEKAPTPIQPVKGQPAIEGLTIVFPYEVNVYNIVNAEGGEWVISNPKKAVIGKSTDKEVSIGITAMSGSFNLIYKRNNQADIVLPITIDTL